MKVVRAPDTLLPLLPEYSPNLLAASLLGTRVDEEFREIEGLDWITALRADSIKKLAKQKIIQLSLFDEKDLAEVTSPDYPGDIFNGLIRTSLRWNVPFAASKRWISRLGPSTTGWLIG